MPSFNTSDQPIRQDNYPLVAATSDSPRPDAVVVGYEPVATADWDGSIDPGNVDDALDQLAERVTDNEGTLGGLTNDHGGLLGLADDDHTQYLLADGSRNLGGHLLTESNQEMRFRDTNQRIYSSAESTLDLDAKTEHRFRINGSLEATLKSDTLEFDQGGGNSVDLHWGLLNALKVRVNAGTEVTIKKNRLQFNNGTIDTYLDWTDSGQLRIGHSTATTIATFRDAEVDVAGIVRGSGLRADQPSPGGSNNTTTITSDTLVGAQFGVKATLNQLPIGYATSVNVRWMKVMIGTTPAIVPYWT